MLRKYPKLKRLLPNNWKAVAWVDADIEFEPEDIIKMLDYNKPVIGGIYPKKKINWDKITELANQTNEITLTSESIQDEKVGVIYDEMIADEVLPLPQHGARLRVQARRPRRSKCHIYAPVFNHRRGRRVGVELVTKLRRRHSEQNLLTDNRPTLFVNTNDGQCVARLGRSRQPHLVAPNDRRRPRLALNRRFPLYAFALAKGHR